MHSRRDEEYSCWYQVKLGEILVKTGACLGLQFWPLFEMMKYVCMSFYECIKVFLVFKLAISQ